MEFAKVVPEGEMIPPWYGVAWVDFYSARAVCMPVPFNLVAGIARAIWIFLRTGHHSVYMSPRAAYRQGRKDERHSKSCGSENQDSLSVMREQQADAGGLITAEALLRSVFTRPDLSEQGREQFFKDFMEGKEELTLGWGDFRMMAATRADQRRELEGK